MATSWKLLVRTWIPRGLVPLVGRVGLIHNIPDSLKPISTIFRFLGAKEIVSALSIEAPTDLLDQTTDARASS